MTNQNKYYYSIKKGSCPRSSTKVADLEEETLITIMAVLIVLSSFTSIILGKLKLPSLIGFLVAGIIIANYIELPEGAEDVVSIFSNLGLIMLMFAIGLEIDLSKMKLQGRFAISIAVVQIPVMLFAGIIMGTFIGMSSVQAITFGAILSGASTAVVLAVLKTNNVLSQEKMEILILVMIIEDIVQVIMISILTPMMQGEDLSTNSLVILVLSIAAFMILCFTLGLRIVPRVINWIYDRSNDESITLLCVGLLFVFALLANMIGLSVAIGAFLVGVMVGMSRPKHVVESFIDPLKTLFMAMFFISVGMEVSIDSLSENIPTILMVYAIFAAFMFTAVNIGYWVANGTSRDGWVSAFSMCTMGEFAFIISKQALDYNVFDQSMYSSVVGAAIVSMVILPFLVRYSEKTYSAAAKITPNFIKRTFGVATRQRDLLYNGLNIVSYQSKARFSRGLTSAAFLIGIIAALEVVFFFLYDPLSDWFVENFAQTSHFWRIGIMIVNLLVLLYPCIRLAKFMRFAVYLMERGRDYMDTNSMRAKRAAYVTEYFSTLMVGSAIALAIVIVVPNGVYNILPYIILIAILAALILIQALKYKNGLAMSLEDEIMGEDPPME